VGRQCAEASGQVVVLCQVKLVVAMLGWAGSGQLVAMSGQGIVSGWGGGGQLVVIVLVAADG
jgi:hypothetical protein